MKRVLYLLAFSIFLFNCKPEETPDPVYDSDYGEGLYILTDQGLVYFDYNSPDTAKIIKVKLKIRGVAAGTEKELCEF